MAKGRDEGFYWLSQAMLLGMPDPVTLRHKCYLTEELYYSKSTREEFQSQTKNIKGRASNSVKKSLQ